MADAIQTSIYKLRPSIAVLDTNGKLSTVDIDFNYLETEFRKHGYQPQQLKPIKRLGHDFRLFYNTWTTSVRWKEFISEIAETGEPILNNDISVNEGFILLVSIKKKSKNDMYAITGGFGHVELQSYINYQFGLDILSRLIKTDEKVLRSAKERNFIGGVLGSVKYFRGDYNLNENENFGNYYYELRAKLDKSLLKHKFKFTDDELKRGGLCDAKTSFTIRKSVTFDRAIEIVDILDTLTKQPPIVDLNLIKRLDKSDRALTVQLDKELTKELFKIYKGKATDVNVEVCHRFFDKYYEAIEFELEFVHARKRYVERTSECASLHDVLELFTKVGVTLTSQTDLKQLLESTKITSFDHSGHQLTVGRLSDHFCAELRFNNKSYFIFNQEWYKLKKEFASILNSQCQDLITAHLLRSTFLKKWNSSKESENDFNAKHIGDKDTLVFDKVTPENIEACDILKWNSNEIYFIHVKEGFNNEMRNLGRQVHISARRIIQDLKSGKEFLGKLYDELINKTATTSYFKTAQIELKKYTRSEFLTLFDKRKPIFVVAVLDSSKKAKRSFADITKYNSNIAKFCLHQLSQEIRLLDTELKILEVQM
jgi:uncharacterized protein (TIGR04141 family)